MITSLPIKKQQRVGSGKRKTADGHDKTRAVSSLNHQDFYEVNLSNAHKFERYASINPQTMESDPLLDQFLSSFACTVAWQRSLSNK